LSKRFNTIYATNGMINTSDARLKKDIADLRYGLAEAMKLRPVTFKWKTGEDEKVHVGLIAQEVERVVPEAVVRGEGEDGAYGLQYDALVPVALRAVQEQQKIIQAQQAELKAVTARLDALEGRTPTLASVWPRNAWGWLVVGLAAIVGALAPKMRRRFEG
jgi:hypothetical protein